MSRHVSVWQVVVGLLLLPAVFVSPDPFRIPLVVVLVLALVLVLVLVLVLGTAARERRL